MPIKNILLRVFLGVAASVLVFLGLAFGPYFARETLRPLLWPTTGSALPIRQRCRCSSYGYEAALAGAAGDGQKAKLVRWSEMETRINADQVYFGWQMLGTPGAPATPVVAFLADAAENPLSPVPLANWQAASPSDRQRVPAGLDDIQTTVDLGGSRIRPSGAKWLPNSTRAVVSPDGSKIAIATLNGPSQPGGLYFLEFWQSWWDIHAEVFRIDTGQRLTHSTVTHIRARHAPAGFRLLWAGSRTLLVSGYPSRFDVEACAYLEPWELHELPPAGLAVRFDTPEVPEVRVTVNPIGFDDAGGLEAIRVTAHLDVRQPGKYYFDATLSRASALSPGRSNRISADLSAGPQELNLVFDTVDFQSAQGRGSFIVQDVWISGPGVQSPHQEDSISLADLPAPDTTVFRIGGEYESVTVTGTKLTSFQGSITYTSPGGLCAWSGAMVQGSRQFPFHGLQHTKPGERKIDFSLRGDALSRFRADQDIEVRVARLTCKGRNLRPRDPSEPYVAVYKVPASER